MIRIALALALVLLPVAAGAFSTFTITPGVVDATHDAATSFNLKCGTTTGGPYPIVTSNGTTIAFSTEIAAPGTYFCIATAVNSGGESGPSPEITFRFAPPSAPTLKVNP